MYVLLILVQSLYNGSALTSFSAEFASETLCNSAKSQFETKVKETAQRVTIAAICVPTSR